MYFSGAARAWPSVHKKAAAKMPSRLRKVIAAFPIFPANPRLPDDRAPARSSRATRSEEHTSELQSLMRLSYAVFCLKKNNIPSHVMQYTPLTMSTRLTITCNTHNYHYPKHTT